MSARRLDSQPHGRCGQSDRRSYLPGGFEGDQVGNRSQGRRAAERTVLEIRLALRMVVMPMVRGSAAGVGRTELHQERGAARGHEPDRDIGTKNQRGQQYDGQYVGSPCVIRPRFHN
jgi:hypothetical protein